MCLQVTSYEFYLLTCQNSYIYFDNTFIYCFAISARHLRSDDTDDNDGVLFTDSEVAVEAIVGNIVGRVFVVEIVEGVDGNIVGRILVLGIDVSSNLVVGLLVLDSINIFEN